MTHTLSTEVPQAEQLGIAGLEGNATTLVEIASGSGDRAAEVVVVSRDRHAEAVCQTAAGGRLTVPLAAGDYLVMARPAVTDASRQNRALCQRLLVDSGRAYGYGIPRSLAVLPEAHPELAAPAPVLTRLAYTGTVDMAARLVVEWSPGNAHCLCLRSAQWGEQWLPYAMPSVAAFYLPDGAYQIRAAPLAPDGTRTGAWSEITELVIAEGRLAAAPSGGGGDLLDWIGVKRGWLPDGAIELHAAATVEGKTAVTFTWRDAESIAALRYVIAYRPESGGEWTVTIAAGPGQTLQLAPGRYRLRHCAVDDLVFLRSEFFAEGLITVSASGPPVLTGAASAADASVAWVPLPASGSLRNAGPGDELSDFIATPVSSLTAGNELSRVDLNALAYSPSPQGDGHGSDIAVARAISRGGLPPDQMAAAGDYFLQAGEIDTARYVFEDLARRYRGVDYAQLRCAQLAAISGREDEARELLTLALLPAKDDPTRSQRLASAVPKTNRDTDSTTQPPGAGTRSGQVAPADNAPQYAALVEELPALRFKAQQYDRLMREVPTLRYKAKLYDEARGGRPAGRGGAIVQHLRRWSDRLLRLR